MGLFLKNEPNITPLGSGTKLQPPNFALLVLSHHPDPANNSSAPDLWLLAGVFSHVGQKQQLCNI